MKHWVGASHRVNLIAPLSSSTNLRKLPQNMFWFSSIGSQEMTWGKNTFRYSGSVICNKLPRTLKGATSLSNFKDIHAHCYCASPVHTLFIGHACATSFSSARTDSKTQQNIERMTFALTWCTNIFVGCSVTPTFFRQITSFSDSFHNTKKQKNSVCGKF